VRTRPTILFFSPAGRSAPDFLAHWVDGKGFTVLHVTEPAVIEEMVLRSLPLLVVIDGAAGLFVAAIVGAAAMIAGYRWARVLGADEIRMLVTMPVPWAARVAALLDATGSKSTR